MRQKSVPSFWHRTRKKTSQGRVGVPLVCCQVNDLTLFGPFSQKDADIEQLLKDSVRERIFHHSRVMLLSLRILMIIKIASNIYGTVTRC